MLFTNTFNYIKNKFTSSIEETEVKIEQPKAKIPREVLLNELDFSIYPEPVIEGNLESDKNMLILDDYDLTNILYVNDIKKMKSVYNKDVEADFKIYKCLNSDSGFQAYKLINLDKVRIDYGVLDLTLGCMVKLPNNEYVEIDGSDIGIYIKKSNPNAKIIFVTAHTMNKDNSMINGYYTKLKEVGIDLYSSVCNKNNVKRHEIIYKFLYGEK